MFFYNFFRKSNGIKYTLFFILLESFGGSSISAFAGADLMSKVYKEPINLVSTTVDIVPTISAPTIVLSSSVSNLKAGETATITFTLSESSNDFVLGDITVSGGALSSFIGSGKNYTVVFTPSPNSTSNGVISVASSKFSDVGGDFNADGGDSNNTATITVDTIVPTITGVSATTNNGSYKESDVIAITVGFSDVVNVTGIPQLTLETGGSDAVVNYSSGTGNNTLTFNYTIGSGETSSKLDYEATNSLELPASNPGTPVYENTGGVGVRAAIRGDYAYLADNGTGLAIINISDPTNPGTPSYVNTTGYARYVVISGNYAYVADEASGLAIINISDPTNPGTPTYVSTSLKVWALAISGNYAYLAVSADGLAIIDISDPTNPGAPVYENTTGYAYGVAISGSHAYVAVSSSGLAVIDISDPTNPGAPIYENTNGSANKVAIKGNYAYVADGGSGLAIIDISDPTNPGTPVYENTTDARGIAISGDYAYVADFGSGLAVIDISDPTDPGTPVYESMSQNALGVTISGNYAYVGASTAGLAIIPTNVNTISDVSGNAATLTLASPGATNSLGVNKDLIVDTTVPADFTVGSVITTGGTVTAGKWNSTNTDIAVTVPLANDATLIGGTLQIQASVASGSYENLGGPHTIGGSEPNTNVTSSFSAATFEALSGGISDGESILFKAILTDKAGNATTGTQSVTSIAFDQSVPAFSSVTPSTGSSVKVADVGYTLSEAIASGTVKYTLTGGSSDSGSPHTQNLSGAELNTGARSLAALSSAPTLVDGATYTIDFNGVDAAGNAATQVSVTGIFFDTTVPADFTVGSVITTGGTVTAGKWNSTNTDIAVTVPLANDATLIGGTLQIQASVASGSYENLGGPHTIGGSEPNTNVTSSFSAATFEALSGGISDGESILFKAILTDKAGNATTGTQSVTSIAFDQSVPAFSSVTPSTGSSVKVADVGYTLSEAIASGTVKYTLTGGSSDSGSPHTQNLSGAELNTGARSLAALSSAPTLVDGATYTIDFNGVDAAGNAATQVSVTGIFFDTTVPADFTVGSVITTGGTVTAGKWNSTNTDIAVTVPLANDATLIGGTLQIQASVASGSYENLGGPHTIGGSEPNTNVTSSFSAATFEALSGGISDGESILFKAILTDKAGNATTGTQSVTSIAFDQSVPAFSSVTPSTGSSVKVADVGYTLSEAIASGTVKYTLTGGSSDSGSPHTQL